MSIPANVKRKVRERAGGKCECCGLDVEKLIADQISYEKRNYGEEISRAKAIKLIGERWTGRWGVKHLFELDHVIPRHRGGEDTADNLKQLCIVCHREKTSGQDVPAAATDRRKRKKHDAHHQKMREKFGEGYDGEPV